MPEPTFDCQSHSDVFIAAIDKPTEAQVALQPVSTDHGPQPQSLVEPQYESKRKSNARNQAPDTSGNSSLRA